MYYKRFVGGSNPTIDEALLGVLRCPVSHARLVEVGPWMYTTDPTTRRKYPIRGGIPVLIAMESTEVSIDEFEQVVQPVISGYAGQGTNNESTSE